jgi:hypothetical protein
LKIDDFSGGCGARGFWLCDALLGGSDNSLGESRANPTAMGEADSKVRGGIEGADAAFPCDDEWEGCLWRPSI